MFDAVDDREHDTAGPLACEPTRAELGDLVVKASTQEFLHMPGGVMRQHGARIFEQRPHQDGSGDKGRRHSQRRR